MHPEQAMFDPPSPELLRAYRRLGYWSRRVAKLEEERRLTGRPERPEVQPIEFNPHKSYSSREAADLMGVGAGTLAVWRCHKKYPELTTYRQGREIRYTAEGIANFIASRTEGTIEGHELKLATG